MENMGPESQGLGKGRRHQVVPRVLIFVRNDDNVLLLRGALDKKIWPGLYNGVGGHVERGEDPLRAAHRELQEECGLNLETSAFHLAAIIDIDMGPENPGIVLFTFVAATTDQITGSSEEGAAEWHPISSLDHLPLVEDLPWLIPTLLEKTPPGMVRFIRYSYDSAGTLQIEETN